MKTNLSFISAMTIIFLLLASPAAAQSSLALRSFQQERNTINYAKPGIEPKELP